MALGNEDDIVKVDLHENIDDDNLGNVLETDDDDGVALEDGRIS